MKITIKKYIAEESKIDYEIESFNEFYGRFYNSCNQEIYFGGFIKDEKIYWIKKIENNFDVNIFDVCRGGHDNLELEIKRAFKEHNFKNIITKEAFNNQIERLKTI